jgi:hypothetical protein
VYVVLKHTPLHEQKLVRDVIVLIEVGLDLDTTPHIYDKLKQVL